MRYFKQISDGYILAVGTGAGGTEITETEYNQILAVIRTKPAASGTTDYRLRTDLTWEPYTIEYVPAVDFDAASAAMLAATEDAMTATRNYDAGDLMSVSGVLYAVTAAIPNGGTITPGVNVMPTTMAEQLALLADKKS